MIDLTADQLDQMAEYLYDAMMDSPEIKLRVRDAHKGKVAFVSALASSLQHININAQIPNYKPLKGGRL